MKCCSQEQNNVSRGMLQAFGLAEYEQAKTYLQEVSDLEFLKEDTNARYAKEKERICALSYNFGLRATNDNQMEDAIQWLTLSIEYATQMSITDKKLQVLLFF